MSLGLGPGDVTCRMLSLGHAPRGDLVTPSQPQPGASLCSYNNEPICKPIMRTVLVEG